MKTVRLMTILAMTLLMLCTATNRRAYALMHDDWQGQWLKGKLSGGGFCNNNGNMEKEKLNGTVYIKITHTGFSGMEAYLVFYDEGNHYWDSLKMDLERTMGNYDRGIFTTYFQITEGADTSDIYLGFVLSGKQNKKTGELKKGTLKTICGAQVGYCTMSIGIKSKTVKEKKVPREVKDALP